MTERRGTRTLWVLGGEPAVADAVERAATDAGGWQVRRGAALEAAPAGRDAVVDLGLPPVEWGSDLVVREGERVEALARHIGEGIPWVRMSVLGADVDAPGELQEAAAAVEERLAGRKATVILRTGILLGDCGLCAVFRSAVERWRLVPLPGIARSRFEPLALADFAAYCVQAAGSSRPMNPRYDLGCGEMVSGDLFLESLADNLGVSRWRVSFPGIAAPGLAAVLAGEGRPAAAVRIWLECLQGGLLPKKLTPLDHFDVAITPLREAMAEAVGMMLPPRRRDQGPFDNWRAPEKKGILWGRGKPPRR